MSRRPDEGSDVACLACARIAARDEKVDDLFTITVCGQCGRMWTFERGAWVKGEVMPRCLVCGHTKCPCCDDWCDTLVPDKEDPEDLDLCCNGRCTFAEPVVVAPAVESQASAKMIDFINVLAEQYHPVIK
jgi:hypothetical protein